MKAERQLDPSNQEDLAKLLAKLNQETNHHLKPWQATKVIEAFKAAGENGVEMDDLLPFFPHTEEGPRRIASAIAKINERFLKHIGLRIEGVIHYHLVKDDQTEES